MAHASVRHRCGQVITIPRPTAYDFSTIIGAPLRLPPSATERTMTQYTLGSAARACGLNKTTVLRAIKAGKVSATRDPHGQWAIDPAELHRVYPPVADSDAEQPPTPLYAPPATPDTTALERAITELREQLTDMRTQRDDMRTQRDAWQGQAESWQAQAQRILVAPSNETPPDATAVTAPRNGWRSWFKAAG
jgi:hypothetical protein